MFEWLGFYFLTVGVLVIVYRLWVLEWWVAQLKHRMGIKQ